MTFKDRKEGDGQDVICDQCMEDMGFSDELMDNMGFLQCWTLEDGEDRKIMHFCDTKCLINWVNKNLSKE